MCTGGFGSNTPPYHSTLDIHGDWEWCDVILLESDGRISYLSMVNIHSMSGPLNRNLSGLWYTYIVHTYTNYYYYDYYYSWGALGFTVIVAISFVSYLPIYLSTGPGLERVTGIHSHTCGFTVGWIMVVVLYCLCFYIIVHYISRWDTGTIFLTKAVPFLKYLYLPTTLWRL